MARSSRRGGLGPACGNKETGVFDRGVCGIDRMSAETTGRGRGRKNMGGGGPGGGGGGRQYGGQGGADRPCQCGTHVLITDQRPFPGSVSQTGGSEYHSMARLSACQGHSVCVATLTECLRVMSTLRALLSFGTFLQGRMS